MAATIVPTAVKSCPPIRTPPWLLYRKQSSVGSSAVIPPAKTAPSAPADQPSLRSAPAASTESKDDLEKQLKEKQKQLLKLRLDMKQRQVAQLKKSVPKTAAKASLNHASSAPPTLPVRRPSHGPSGQGDISCSSSEAKKPFRLTPAPGAAWPSKAPPNTIVKPTTTASARPTNDPLMRDTLLGVVQLHEERLNEKRRKLADLLEKRRQMCGISTAPKEDASNTAMAARSRSRSREMQ
eukprot:gnl/MRDRNA2_/MRDRNA2_126610_c0_seq1.p1 gnl/MRDRNA2_/MRDRNA2_126610_c0~~gnl/MRDRNA2_/MRDRNA2_126610_c0_seq1.p1  ORF type:complete len:238 (+),score=37.78 gnl/MRDRNA2_/MRDRNA2_126610_c0_seq1:150-863(+)